MCRERERLEPLPLRERVENHVVRDVENLDQVTLVVGSRESVDFAAEFLTSEARLVEAAGAGSAQIARDERSEMPHRERLEREQDLRVARTLYLVENLQVLLDCHLVDDEARRGYARGVELPESLRA